MSVSTAVSVSAAVLPVLSLPPRPAIGLGHGHVLVDGYVITLVPVDGPRMPNGLETSVRIERGQRVRVGDGRIGPVAVTPSTALWDPVPRPRVSLRTTSTARVDVEWLVGRGPGLTPAGDDVLMGYIAGLVLFHERHAEAQAIATLARPRTTALSATLLEHAARGELPGPAHAFLERGEAAPLLRWGRSSGRHLALGLALAFDDPRTRRLIPIEREVRTNVLAA